MECPANLQSEIRNLKSRRGFSLVELLVVIAVIVILVALLLPAIGASRSRARQSQCASNQRQVWLAWTRANSRSPSQPVRGSAWMQRISPYLPGGASVIFCPDDVSPSQSSSYAFNANAWQFSSAPDAGRIVLLDYKLTEAKVIGQTLAQLNDLTTGWPGGQAARHFQRENVTLGDGHSATFEPRAIDPRYCVYYVQYWRPEKDQNINLAGCLALGSTPPELGSTSTTTSGGSTTGGSTTGPPPPCPGLSTTISVNVTAAVSGVNEGAAGQITPVTLTVTLSQVASQTVTVQVVTVDETATAGLDYTALNQTVTFTAGQISKTVTVNVLGDDVSEPDETFRVEPRNPTFGGTACQQLTAGNYARVTIYNDDPTPPTSSGPDPCLSNGAPQQVADATNWLVRHQFADGSWSFQSSTHPDCHGQCGPDAAGTFVHSPAATGFALLPLLGSGNSPVKGPYKDAVCRGVNYLLAMQWPNGSFEADANAPPSYAHLINHLALAEAYENTKQAVDSHCTDTDPGGCQVDLAQLKAAVQRAISFTLAGRYPDYGWRYNTLADVSHEAWGVAALRVSARAGLSVPQSAFDEARIYLASSCSTLPITDSSVTIGSRYCYGTYPVWGFNYNDSSTAQGLLAQYYTGVPASHAAIQQFVASRTQPFVESGYQQCALYCNMQTTHLKYFAGGAQWTQWNQAIQLQLFANQSHAGHSNGSISMPTNPVEQWYGGRLCETVEAMLCLQAYFTGLRLAH
ncbi:MAG: prepilin-type N-terminal cleavage/methylation domain-containing protein [Planctomycetia bacterium]|nr:prepilin-type N-terminal cleavage/methylation domain-containing protein [Planctomycetia bacterium]